VKLAKRIHTPMVANRLEDTHKSSTPRVVGERWLNQLLKALKSKLRCAKSHVTQLGAQGQGRLCGLLVA